MPKTNGGLHRWGVGMQRSGERDGASWEESEESEESPGTGRSLKVFYSALARRKTSGDCGDCGNLGRMTG